MGWLRRLFGGRDASSSVPTEAPELLGHVENHRVSDSRSSDAPRGGYAVLDLETTGLSPRAHRALELAVVLVDRRGNIEHEWATLLDPQGPVGATHIHGIRDADVRGAPTFDVVVPRLTNLLAGRAVVAHNVSFDTGFLKFEFGRAGWGWPTVPTLCTLEESFHFLPTLDRRRLVDCCAAAGIRLTHAHSALGDARATAELLDRYLNQGCGVAPLPRHRNILGAAVRTTWPSAPGDGRIADAYAPPRDLHPRVKQAIVAARTLPSSTLLDRFTLADAMDDGAPKGALSYIETLVEVLEDGQVSEDERAALSDVADLYNLTRDDVRAANLGLVRALAREALEDGVLARSERAELRHISALIDVPEQEVKDLLDGEEEERLKLLSTGLPALPERWTLGEPLRVGQRVVFTGCDDGERAVLEGRARALGVRVTGSVSRRTAMLVSDGSFSGAKAAAAAQLGTRVVHPGDFTKFLDHIQPTLDLAPLELTQLRAVRRIAPDTAPTLTTATSFALPHGDAPAACNVREGTAQPALVRPSASAVRAWARDQGLEVGVRGRLASEVWEAYDAAHS